MLLLFVRAVSYIDYCQSHADFFGNFVSRKITKHFVKVPESMTCFEETNA